MKRQLNSRSLEQLLQAQTALHSGSLQMENGHDRLLADLLASSGPWMAMPNGEVLLDAMQAGGPLGFNAGACFGAAQYLESWTGQTGTETARLLQVAFAAFLLRKSGWKAGDESVPDDPATLALAYIQSNVLDQFESQVVKLELLNRESLSEFFRNHSGQFAVNQVDGLFAAFDCVSAGMAARFCSCAIGFGILLPHNKDRTVSVRINLSWSEETLEIFWRQMDLVATAVFQDGRKADDGVFVSLRDPAGYSRFHQAMVRGKLAIASGQLPATSDSASGPVLDLIRETLKDIGLADCNPVVVKPENWPQYRSAVEDMQGEIYEPARQTGVGMFDTLVRSTHGMALLILQGNRIIAIAFAGPLSLFPGERGTTDDPWRNDPDALYMLDLTVRKPFRGTLGRLMKQALTLLAVLSGCSAIHGRNRDRLAGSMWAINLSVGSFQIRHLADDYPDNEASRDCIYYRCPLRWSMPDKDSPEHETVARLCEMSTDQLGINLARLANGYPAAIDEKPGTMSGNLVPVWDRRNWFAPL